MFKPKPAPINYVEVQHAHNVRSDGCVYNQFVQHRVRECLAFLRKDKVTSVLDVGCRCGYALDTFQQHLPNARVVGLDLVPEFVEEAREVCDEVYVGDVHALPFKDQEFDLVFSSHTMEHCYDPQLALSEIRRVAKVAVFLVLPLEQPDPNNPSHYFETTNPLDWANMAQGDGWSTLSLHVNDRGDVSLWLVRGSMHAVHGNEVKRGK